MTAGAAESKAVSPEDVAPLERIARSSAALKRYEAGGRRWATASGVAECGCAEQPNQIVARLAVVGLLGVYASMLAVGCRLFFCECLGHRADSCISAAAHGSGPGAAVLVCCVSIRAVSVGCRLYARLSSCCLPLYWCCRLAVGCKGACWRLTDGTKIRHQCSVSREHAEGHRTHRIPMKRRGHRIPIKRIPAGPSDPHVSDRESSDPHVDDRTFRPLRDP